MQLCLISAQLPQGWALISPWVHCHSLREHHKPPPSPQLGHSVHQPGPKTPESASHPIQRGEKASWLQAPVCALTLSSDSLCPHGLYPPGCSVHGILQARMLELGGHILLWGNLPNPGIKPVSPALQEDSLQTPPETTPLATSGHSPRCEQAATLLPRDPDAFLLAPVSYSVI